MPDRILIKDVVHAVYDWSRQYGNGEYVAYVWCQQVLCLGWPVPSYTPVTCLLCIVQDPSNEL